MALRLPGLAGTPSAAPGIMITVTRDSFFEDSVTRMLVTLRLNFSPAPSAGCRQCHWHHDSAAGPGCYWHTPSHRVPLPATRACSTARRPVRVTDCCYCNTDSAVAAAFKFKVRFPVRTARTIA